jgi:hypothetical protein
MVALIADITSRTGAGLIGVFLFVATTMSVMRTVVIPRTLRSLISDTVQRAVVGAFIMVSKVRRTYRARDGVMAWAGPSTILLQLITWLVLYVISFGFIIYGFSGQGLGESLRQSGSSLFTLGFATIDKSNQTIIDFAAAATGPIIVALMIGFLPSIYSAYLDREVTLTMLTALGGEPAWGPEVLARAQLSGRIDELPDMYREWTLWSAHTHTTHITYQILVWVRSARLTRHYLVAILAVLDAAALQAALCSKVNRREIYDLLLQGSQLMTVLFAYQRQGRNFSVTLPHSAARRNRVKPADLANAPGWSQGAAATEIAAYHDVAAALPPAALAVLKAGFEQPLQLTRADFDHAVAMLKRANFPIDKDLDVAWLEFQQTRRRYEFPALELTYLVDATPAPWSGPRRVPTPTVWPMLASDVNVAREDVDGEAS